MEWRSIDTAPMPEAKSGPDVLARVRFLNGHVVPMILHWNGIGDEWTDERGSVWSDVTHWMPLPSVEVP